MTNLLSETIAMLAKNGKTPADVLWVGTRRKRSGWNNFAVNADYAYDPGYGEVDVNKKLIVVGATWWLERKVFAGFEEWVFKPLPEKPPEGKYRMWNQ